MILRNALLGLIATGDAVPSEECGRSQTLVDDTCVTSGCESCPGEVNAVCLMTAEQNWKYICQAKSGYGCVGADCFDETQCTSSQYDCTFNPLPYKDIWHGEGTVATWSAVGGDNTDPFQASLGYNNYDSNMFDGVSMTKWHGAVPAEDQNKVTVEFDSPIKFYQLMFQAEAFSPSYMQPKFGNVCLFLDGMDGGCTIENRETSAGEKVFITIGRFEEQPIVSNVELRFPEGVSAVIAELEIYYTSVSYTEWADWTSCSMTCGEGVRTRLRTCSTDFGDDCAQLGESYEDDTCNIDCPDDAAADDGAADDAGADDAGADDAGDDDAGADDAGADDAGADDAGADDAGADDAGADDAGADDAGADDAGADDAAADDAAADDNAADGNVVGGEGTPCPSDCWNWNASEQKCKINEDAGCFSLICEHDSIMVSFASKLYGISDEDESDVLDGPEANFDTTESEWKINCNLGECDMIAETEEKDGKNHLTFSFDVGKKMRKVVMSGSDVFIDPVAAELTFKCMYLAEVDLTSNQFTVKGATATGESVKTGFLDDGFNLAIYTDATYETVANGENVFVGYPVFGKVEWSVTTAQTAVNFYILTCNVQSDSAKIAVVRNTCYSTTLGARQLQEDKLVAASSAFTFTAFTIGAYEMDTTVACTVRLCLVSDSDCAASLIDDDANCPDDEAYGYKAVTFQ